MRKNWKPQKVEKKPKVLSLDDLQFGFKIWFGTCLCACFTFLIERGIKLRNPKIPEARRHSKIKGTSNKSKIPSTKIDTSKSSVDKNKQNHWIKVKAVVFNVENKNTEEESNYLSDEKLTNVKEIQIGSQRNLLVNDQIYRNDQNENDEIEFDNLEIIDIEND